MKLEEEKLQLQNTANRNVRAGRGRGNSNQNSMEVAELTRHVKHQSVLLGQLLHQQQQQNQQQLSVNQNNLTNPLLPRGAPGREATEKRTFENWVQLAFRRRRCKTFLIFVEF